MCLRNAGATNGPIHAMENTAACVACRPQYPSAERVDTFATCHECPLGQGKNRLQFSNTTWGRSRNSAPSPSALP